ncbi:MAG: hypothetical protein ACAH80_15900 [Alphaproteobacteria bacterium]
MENNKMIRRIIIWGPTYGMPQLAGKNWQRIKYSVAKKMIALDAPKESATFGLLFFIAQKGPFTETISITPENITHLKE